MEDEEIPYMAPRLQNFPFNSIEELAEDMRHNGLRWRHNLRERVAEDPTLKRLLDWVTYRPSPASEPTRSLEEILFDLQLLPHDQSQQIMDMGDGYVQMPVTFFEHHASYRVSEGLPREHAERGIRRRGRVRVSILVLHAAHATTPNPQRGRHPAP